jgi:hypothetical protein
LLVIVDAPEPSRISSTSRRSSHRPRLRTPSALGPGRQVRTVIKHRCLDHVVADVDDHLDRLPPPDPYRIALVAASLSVRTMSSAASLATSPR